MNAQTDRRPASKSPRNGKSRWRFINMLIETFGFSPWLATALALFLCLLVGAALIWLWLSAPPDHLTLTSGPPGSTFERYADAYREALAERGVTLRVIPSAGSIDNLRRLELGTQDVEIGFVQSGLAGDSPPPYLMSLGSIAYQPLFVFYRGTTRIVRLAELAGKRIGVGARGSGTHSLALALLEANGINATGATLVENASGTVADDLLQGRLDAVFLMGDSAPISVLRALLRNPEVQLYHFAQAEAYVRRMANLNRIVLPRGSFDFGRDLPPQDIALIGPTVELLANQKLNSALSDMLLDVAKQVHGRSTLLAKKGEFPAPLDHGVPISDAAQRFYKSGIGFTYRLVGQVGSFRLGSLLNRILIAIVPMLLLLIPAMRLLPIVYRWSVQLRIYRCYRPLLRLERDAKERMSSERARDLLGRLDEIEQEVNALRVPASFAYQFYALRVHVVFVRSRLQAAAAQ